VSGKRILAVDDDPSIREMVRDYLVDNDFQVETAANGDEMNQILESKGGGPHPARREAPGEDGFGIAGRCA
jgi:two-component system phosphate regulon response regulator OmpR